MGKVVLITGASSGIGKEFAYKYASNGYNLLLVARSRDILLNLKEELERDYNIKVFVLVKDLSLPNSSKSIYEFTKENNLEVDILLNNAGFGDFGPFLDSDIEKQTNMIYLNIISLIELSRYFVSDMKKRNYGKLLNVASIAGFMPGPYMSVYYASKSFVLNFTEALSYELKDYNIKVSVLCPGPTRTNFEKNANVKFGNINTYSAKFVVDYTYKKFMKTKKVIILPGFYNKIFSITPKLLPRFIIRKMMGKLQSKFKTK